MIRFRYLRDPLFLTGCLAYSINRWVLMPAFHSPFLHRHFNDLWLIPCALPPVLRLYRLLGLRDHDGMPGLDEIAGHLVLWSILCELVGPMFVHHARGDILDVAAYAAGAIVAGVYWSIGQRNPAHGI